MSKTLQNEIDIFERARKSYKSSKISDFRHIELNVFLGKIGIAATGGQAKIIIRSGEIKVNKEPETRNKRKLHAGDVVEYLGKKHVVKEELVR